MCQSPPREAREFAAAMSLFGAHLAAAAGVLKAAVLVIGFGVMLRNRDDLPSRSTAT